MTQPLTPDQYLAYHDKKKPERHRRLMASMARDGLVVILVDGNQVSVKLTDKGREMSRANQLGAKS